MFVGGIILAVATMGTDQAVLQRYFTAKSERECSLSLKFFSVLLIPYNCLLILIGVFLFAFYHQNPDLARTFPNPTPYWDISPFTNCRASWERC